MIEEFIKTLRIVCDVAEEVGCNERIYNLLTCFLDNLETEEYDFDACERIVYEYMDQIETIREVIDTEYYKLERELLDRLIGIEYE